ncbi:hypothetical protein TNCV_4574441 [Trichonephila clavipes]|nr:hypothetical protein TNCV_4574441 [Trichonephila clavipes]
MACQDTRSFANRACLDALGRQLQPSRDTGELTAQMQRLWQDLPQGVISDLIESMPRRISVLVHQFSLVWAGVIAHKEEVWSMCSTGKSNIECKNLVPVQLTYQSASMKHMKVEIPVCNDACTNHQITLTIVVVFDNVRGLKSTPELSSNENTSRITVYTESRLITEENPPPIILCPRQVF